MVNPQLLRMSKELGIDLVATNDVHYTYAEDAAAHDILLCLQTGKKLQDEDRMRYEGGQYYVKSPEEMEALFPYATEALENTWKIAQRCHVEIEFGVTKLPKFDVPKEYDLLGISEQALSRRAGEALPATLRRSSPSALEYELSVIKTMGYVDYFLIVWDFIRYARDHGYHGRARDEGLRQEALWPIRSASRTSDPIRYNLLFERFLNPERVSMPDIDVDFCFERRQEVIDYVVRKVRKRPGGTDRHLRYAGGPRCDPGCGPCYGSALCKTCDRHRENGPATSLTSRSTRR